VVGAGLCGLEEHKPLLSNATKRMYRAEPRTKMYLESAAAALKHDSACVESAAIVTRDYVSFESA
jgi:hypothetical protein